MGRWTVDSPQRLNFSEPVQRLDVRLVSGRLNVVGSDGPPRLEVTEIGAKPLEVSLDNGLLSIRYDDEPTNWWRNGVFWLMGGRKRYHADISVAVPHETAARLAVVSGSLVASALHNGAETEVTSGRLTLLGLNGRTSAKMVSGPIEALGVSGELHMETVSGELVVGDSTAHRVYAKTISGSITADLDNPSHDSQIQLETVSGEITVRVREDSDLDVHLNAISGRVTSAFPEVRVESSHTSAAWKRAARGVLGHGTGRLWVNAVSGSISLLRRPVDDEADYVDDEPAAPAGGEDAL
jgi:hypothetical protein